MEEDDESTGVGETDMRKMQDY